MGIIIELLLFRYIREYHNPNCDPTWAKHILTAVGRMALVLLKCSNGHTRVATLMKRSLGKDSGNGRKPLACSDFGLHGGSVPIVSEKRVLELRRPTQFNLNEALVWASKKGNMELVKTLIELNADANGRIM